MRSNSEHVLLSGWFYTDCLFTGKADCIILCFMRTTNSVSKLFSIKFWLKRGNIWAHSHG